MTIYRVTDYFVIGIYTLVPGTLLVSRLLHDVWGIRIITIAGRHRYLEHHGEDPLLGAPVQATDMLLSTFQDLVRRAP